MPKGKQLPNIYFCEKQHIFDFIDSMTGQKWPAEDEFNSDDILLFIFFVDSRLPSRTWRTNVDRSPVSILETRPPLRTVMKQLFNSVDTYAGDIECHFQTGNPNSRISGSGGGYESSNLCSGPGTIFRVHCEKHRWNVGEILRLPIIDYDSIPIEPPLTKYHASVDRFICANSFILAFVYPVVFEFLPLVAMNSADNFVNECIPVEKSIKHLRRKCSLNIYFLPKPILHLYLDSSFLITTYMVISGALRDRVRPGLRVARSTFEVRLGRIADTFAPTLRKGYFYSFAKPSDKECRNSRLGTLRLHQCSKVIAHPST